MPNVGFYDGQVLHANVVLCNFGLAFRSIVTINFSTVMVSTVVMYNAVNLKVLIKELLGVSHDVTLLATYKDTVYKTTTMLNISKTVHPGPCGATMTMTAMIVFKALSVFLCPVLCETNVFSLSPSVVKLFANSAIRRMTRIMNTTGTVKTRIDGGTVVMGVVEIVVLMPMLLIVT